MADYDNSSGKDFWGDMGAGILPYCPLTKRFLLNLRSQDVNEPGTYGIWGGKLDWGEDDPKEAAMREFEEETKYKGKIDIKPLCVYKTDGFEYHNYIGITYKEFLPDVSDCWESDGYKWVTLEEMEEMNLHFGVKYILDECSLELDDLIRENLIVKFEDFVLENDNLNRSIAGMDKFGMVDYDKFPNPLEEKLKELGFRKSSPKGIPPYGGSAIPGQIYSKDENDNKFSMVCFVSVGKEIVIDMYAYDTGLTSFYSVNWLDYDKVINFLNDYEGIKGTYLTVIEPIDDQEERSELIKKLALKYELKYTDSYIS